MAVLVAAGTTTVVVSRMTGASRKSLAVQVCSATYTTVYSGVVVAASPPSSLRCTVRLAGQPCSALRVHL